MQESTTSSKEVIVVYRRQQEHGALVGQHLQGAWYAHLSGPLLVATYGHHGQEIGLVALFPEEGKH